MLEQTHDEQEIIQRVAALDIGKAELVCCVRVPDPKGGSKRLGGLKHGEQPPAVPRGRIPAGLTPKQLMSRKLRTKKGKAAYARRKAMVEPVFGQINVAQGGHQLRLRGQVKADFEWTIHLACHNYRKLAGSGWTTTQLATT